MAPALEKLSSDVGDRAAVERYVGDYLGLLDRRLATLEGDIAQANVKQALVTTLSLLSASAVLGAADVVEAVAGLRDALLDHRLDQAAEQLEIVRRRAATVRGRLVALGYGVGG